jgi:16S rRNA (guanine527-N7)-methyltransferase
MTGDPRAAPVASFILQGGLHDFVPAEMPSPFMNPPLPSTIFHAMDPARIAELLQPFTEGPRPRRPIREWPEPSTRAESFASEETASVEESAFVTPALLENISIYIDVLLRWNARINLTAVRDRDEIVTRHFGESFLAARYLFPDRPFPGKETARPSGLRSEPRPQEATLGLPVLAPNDLIDLGSGAGFPGLPIKMWAPAIRVTLIESNQKKATFLREAVRALTLTDINVFSRRGENFTGQARVVTLRAVERFDSVLPAAASLVAPSGCLALLVGGAQLDRARQLLPALAWQDPISVPLSSNRALLLGSKS